ncbi:hypothetical protein GCM10027414_04890 [Humibacter ginsengiterrae]
MGEEGALSSEEEARKIFEAARLGEHLGPKDDEPKGAVPTTLPQTETPTARDDSFVETSARREHLEPSEPSDGSPWILDPARDPEDTKFEEEMDWAPDSLGEELGAAYQPFADASLRASPRDIVQRLRDEARTAGEQGFFE